MISMSQVYSIRQLRKQEETVAEIACKVGVRRNTMYNCLAEDDLPMEESFGQNQDR